MNKGGLTAHALTRWDRNLKSNNMCCETHSRRATDTDEEEAGAHNPWTQQSKLLGRSHETMSALLAQTGGPASSAFS